MLLAESFGEVRITERMDSLPVSQKLNAPRKLSCYHLQGEKE